ncbi:MAG TPA: L-histidine N(alpha)-methyltransferase [Candidatus Polarisedimenticolia bacterium]|nr:L-histidine N(alpha)-methyltransferase [Candidatus Polarisedimenticolia bacterium]
MMHPAEAIARWRALRLARAASVKAFPSEPEAIPASPIEEFGADVRRDLTRVPRQLPSRYLYDDLGSALFEAICRLPWYPLTRAELRLLRRHALEILDSSVRSIVELGPGSGAKLSALIAGAGNRRGVLDVHLVDLSSSALAQAGRTLAELHDVRVVAHQATYEAGLGELGRARSDGGGRLALFLGSNLGNFDPPGREAFLGSIRSSLGRGDRLLLGVDLVKPVRDLLLAYDDPIGVTASFNLNLLARINQELEGDFDLRSFSHRAIWNEEHSRIEMHLRSDRRQRVAVDRLNLAFVMEAGETIWTESSYKYRLPEIASMLKRAGFELRAQWIDAGARFALTLAAAL